MAKNLITLILSNLTTIDPVPILSCNVLWQCSILSPPPQSSDDAHATNLAMQSAPGGLFITFLQFINPSLQNSR